MHRMNLSAETLRPAPLGSAERIDEVRRVLMESSIFARRMSHAASVGLTITYAHLSEAADAPLAARVLAEGLDWEDTEVTHVAGMVAVSTQRG